MHFFLFFAIVKSSRIRQRLSAILVILVLCQQVGAGLYIHNLCHKQERISEAHSKSSIVSEAVVDCSCVDNFLTPFLEAEAPVFTALSNIHQLLAENLQPQIPSTDLVFIPLRGPPTA